MTIFNYSINQLPFTFHCDILKIGSFKAEILGFRSRNLLRLLQKYHRASQQRQTSSVISLAHHPFSRTHRNEGDFALYAFHLALDAPLLQVELFSQQRQCTIVNPKMILDLLPLKGFDFEAAVENKLRKANGLQISGKSTKL